MRSAAFFENDARRKSGGGRRPTTRPVLPDFDEPADGSGSRRRAPPAEPESPVAKPSNWFLHDDRDLQAEGPGARGGSGDQIGGRRDSRRGGRVQPGPGAPRYNKPGEWEYVDPKGMIQGPFSSKEVLKWADAGFFTPDQQMRRAGEVKFASLRACMHQLQQDVKGPPAELPTQRGGRVGSIPRTDPSYRKPRPSRSLEQAPDGSYKGHPADALLSPDKVDARREELEAGPTRGGYGRRSGHEGPGGRGQGRDGEQGYGRRGGRGGYGDGAMRSERRGGASAAAQPSPEPEGPKLPHSLKVAQRLFTGDAMLATEEPVWRYVDPSGQTQGPFPARNMLEWYRRGLLNDMSLQTCGAERKVAPPDFPQPEHYRPLGTLLQSIKRGQRFHPLTVVDIRAGQGSAYHPFGKGPREASTPTSSAQEPQARAGADPLPKRQAPSARGQGRTQEPTRGATADEDGQRVSLQLAHGATEEEGIKVALSMGSPASVPTAADWLPADDTGEMSRTGDSTAPAAGPADGDGSLGPLAAGTHGKGASHDAAATPVLAPASQLGLGFVATPDKPTALDFMGEAPQAPSLPSAAEHTSAGTAEHDTSTQHAAGEDHAAHPAAADESMLPIEAGSTAGPLAEAAAAHSKESAEEEPVNLIDADMEPKEAAAPKTLQPDREAEFVPGEGSLSNLHVHSAPSKALDAAERGESPAAPTDGDAARDSFAEATAPDAAAAEKVHDVLEDNVKAVEAANDSTADTLDAGLHSQGGAPADTADGQQSGKDSAAPSALSHMTQPAGESAGDAKVTEPATESPELLGVAGAVKQKTQPGESAEPEVAADYHTKGTGKPPEGDSAAEPAMADPEVLDMAAVGEQGSQHAETKAHEGPSCHSGQPEQDSRSAQDDSAPGAEPVTQTKLIGKEEPVEESSVTSMTEADNVSEMTQAAAEMPGEAKATKPDAGSVEVLGAAKTTDASSEPSAGIQSSAGAAAGIPANSSSNGATEAKTVSDVTKSAAETPDDAKAAEPAQVSLEFLGVAKATDAAPEPAAPSDPAAAAPEGDKPKTAPAQETSTEAADDESGSGAEAGNAPSREEGSEQGKKEHGSLFASARAFFKRKEADGKH